MISVRVNGGKPFKVDVESIIGQSETLQSLSDEVKKTVKLWLLCNNDDEYTLSFFYHGTIMPLDTTVTPKQLEDPGLELHVQVSKGFERFETSSPDLKFHQSVINSLNKDGNSMLFVSLGKDNAFENAHKLLSKGADVNLKMHDGRTALHRASELGRVDLVDLICHFGAAVDAQCSAGMSALHYACKVVDREKRIAVFKKLLDLGCSTKLVSAKHGTVLHAAVELCCDETVEFLLHSGVDCKAVQLESRRTALIIACASETKRLSKKCFESLCRRSRHVIDEKDNMGNSAIQYSFEKNPQETLALLNSGADPDPLVKADWESKKSRDWYEVYKKVNPDVRLFIASDNSVDQVSDPHSVASWWPSSHLNVMKWAKDFGKFAADVLCPHPINSLERLFDTMFEGLIGQHKLKDQLKDYLMGLASKHGSARRRSCFSNAKLSMMAPVITLEGPPGVGKTTVAKLVSEYLQRTGLRTGKFIEVANALELLAPYQGQTNGRVNRFIQQAKGGVLFVDEVYNLNKKAGNGTDYGAEAINSLMGAMGEHSSSDVCFIFGGYGYNELSEENLMEEFLTSNPGLKSRVARRFSLEPYTVHELDTILFHQLKARHEEVSISNVASKRFLRDLRPEDRYRGNGRMICFIAEAAVDRAKAERKAVAVEHLRYGADIFMDNMGDGLPKKKRKVDAE